MNFISIIGFILLAFFGLLISRRLSPPKRTSIWIVLILILVISGYVGTNTSVVKLINVDIRLNSLIQGFFSGIILGLVIKKS